MNLDSPSCPCGAVNASTHSLMCDKSPENRKGGAFASIKGARISTDAMSTTTTLVDKNDKKDEVDYQRFTATGRPHNPNSGTESLASTSGFGDMYAAYHLPHRFTDESIISVPIPASELEDPDAPTSNDVDSSNPEVLSAKHSKPSFFSKLSGKGAKKSPKKHDFKIVLMSRWDYLKYWAKDDKGNYIGTEPQGLGGKLLREKIRLEKEQGLPSSIASEREKMTRPVDNRTTMQKVTDGGVKGLVTAAATSGFNGYGT